MKLLPVLFGTAKSVTQPPPRTKAYLGGPDVFLRNTLAIGTIKKQILSKYGIDAYYPISDEFILTDLRSRTIALRIAQNNEEAMRQCDIGIFNMTPWQGPSMDVGTAYEMGFMRGLGKPVYGYTSHLDSFEKRLMAMNHGTPWVTKRTEPRDKRSEDVHGRVIEKFGPRMADNLMIDNAVSNTIIQRAAEPANRERQPWRNIDPLVLNDAVFEAFQQVARKIGVAYRTG
jgi:nucleoside 2-deoxyribosyltransferase